MEENAKWRLMETNPIQNKLGKAVKKVAHKNIKKNCPQKLLIIGPKLFFSVLAGCPNGPKTKIPYHQKPLNAGLGI